MEFEWDPKKADANKRKHGVTFQEGTSIFGDPLAITFADPDHSEDEERSITFGLSIQKQLLVVSHADRENKTRIISVRRMTREERKIYEEG
jgi:uncharacterized DUF497 family protein